jgi:amino acid transporter
MRDWRLHPFWGPAGFFLSFLSLFTSASPVIKTLVIIAVLAASALALFGKPTFRRKPVASRYGDVSSSITPDAGTPFYMAGGEEEHTKLEVPWLGRIMGFLIVAVIVGPPGILLTLTTVLWLHIIGIILLVFLGIAGLFMLSLPEVELMLWKSGKKLQTFRDNVNEVSTTLHEMAEELRRRGRE